MNWIKQMLVAWVNACAAKAVLRLDDPVPLRSIVTPGRIFIAR